MREETNKKLKRHISALDEEGQIWCLFTISPEGRLFYQLERANVPRKEAFDWLHGKDEATAAKSREEMLEAVREMLNNDVARWMQYVEESDWALRDFYSRGKDGMILRPLQR